MIVQLDIGPGSFAVRRGLSKGCYFSEGSALVALVALVRVVHVTSAYSCVVSWDWDEVLPIIQRIPRHWHKQYPNKGYHHSECLVNQRSDNAVDEVELESEF